MTQPVSLTERDIELCWLECELQGATAPRQIAGLQAAYALAKQFAYNRRPETVTSADLLALEAKLAGLIEPDYATYRVGPAVFLAGSEAVPAYEIEERLKAWAAEFADDRSNSPLVRYEQYEYAHPRGDGNGRNGFCTWSIDVFWATGQWPTELPPPIFGPGCTSVRDQNYYEGVFGA